MKVLALLVFGTVVSTGFSATVGETFDQLVAEKGKPKSQMTAGDLRVVTYPDALIKLRDNVIVSVKPIAAPTPTPVPPTPLPGAMDPAAVAKDPQVVEARAALQKAIDAVQKIANQPVSSITMTAAMRVGRFAPGWFHEGAVTPDFETVDVRKSQEFIYDKYDYVTSDVTPGVAFEGKDLEFNSMIKLFYTDRNLPKKRLTEREMVEINRQYRLIAKYRKLLQQRLPSVAPAEQPPVQ